MHKRATHWLFPHLLLCLNEGSLTKPKGSCFCKLSHAGLCSGLLGLDAFFCHLNRFCAGLLFILYFLTKSYLVFVCFSIIWYSTCLCFMVTFCSWIKPGPEHALSCCRCFHLHGHSSSQWPDSGHHSSGPYISWMLVLKIQWTQMLS